MVSKSRPIDLVSKYNTDVFKLLNKDIFGAVEQPLGSTHGAVARILSVDYENLLKTLMPTIISTNPNDPIWYKKVKNYWDSFGIKVPVGGKTLETGYSFNFEEQGVRKTNINSLIKRAKEKDKFDIIDDESLAKYVLKSVPEFERYNYATPINVEHYLIWLFCLGHRKVAKQSAAIEKSTNIEFVLIDPKEIDDQRRSQHTTSIEATKKYIEILTDRTKVRNILYIKGIDASRLDDLDCDAKLKHFADTNAKEFLAMVGDTNGTLKATIEKYCIAGVLRRLPNSSIIVDANDTANVVGNTIDEAIAFFSSETPDRVAKVKEFNVRYTQLTKK